MEKHIKSISNITPIKYIKQVFKVLIVLIIILTSPIQAFALDSDVSGGGTGGYGDENSNYGFGVKANVGYRIYCIDNSGNTIENRVADLLYQDTTADIESLYTQANSVATDKFIGCEIPKCINDSGSDWSSNYEAVREFMYAESDYNGETTQNINVIIYEYLGEEVKKQFIDGGLNIYFCIEPIFRMGIYTSGSQDSFAGTFYGTVRNWGELFYTNEISNYSFLGIGVCESMPNSMYIQNDYPEMGLFAPVQVSGRLTPEQVISYNYGLGLFWNQDFDAIQPEVAEKGMTHTWDINLGSTPGKAPIPSIEGEVLICKVYSSDESTDKVYWRGSNPSIITIEDETEFKVTEWFTSTSSEMKTGSWNEITNGLDRVQEGSTADRMSMSENEKILFIHLEKKAEEQEPEATSGDLAITESKISTLQKEYNWGITRTYKFNEDLQDHTAWCLPILNNPPCSDGLTEANKFSIYNANIGMDEDYMNYLEGSKNLAQVNQVIINQWSKHHNGITTRPSTGEPSEEEETGNTDDIYIYRKDDSLTLRPAEAVPEHPSKTSEAEAWKEITDTPNIDDLTSDETMKEKMSLTGTSLRREGSGKVDYNLTISLFTSDEDGVEDLYQSRKDNSTFHGVYSLCNHLNSEGEQEHPYKEQQVEYLDFFIDKHVTGLKKNITVEVQTYIGEEKEAKEFNDKTYKNSSSTTSNKSLRAGKEIWGTTSEVLSYNFVPYIMMSYTSPSVESSEIKNKFSTGNQHQKLQKVASKWERNNSTQSYAETEFTSSESLELSSGLWATDAALVSYSTGLETSKEDAWKQANKVLKFGAVYGLHGENTLKARDYQIWQGTLQPEESDFNSLKQEHENYVESIENTLTGKKLQLRVSEDWSLNPYTSSSSKQASYGNMLPSIDMETGAGHKYLLDENGEPEGQADSGTVLAKAQGTKIIYHKLSTDYMGNVYYTSSTSLDEVKGRIGSLVGTKKESGAQIALKNSSLVELERKFEFVSRFLDSLERNTGSDKTAEWAKADGKWYNEAAEVYMIEQVTDIKVSVDYRTVTNGIKGAEMTSKFNTEDLKAMQAGWCFEDLKEPVGEFRGTGVKLNNSRYLLYSNTFYSVNMSATDNG